MDRKQLVAIKNDLKLKGNILPEYVEQDPYHWNSRLYMASLLQESKNNQDAYALLRGIYEDNTFRFDKGIHGAYEEYIIEKSKIFPKVSGT